MSAATAPAAALVGVSRTYGTGSSAAVVLRDVDLEVWPGEVVALVGRSGSGKSTLCHLLAGLEPATSGDVHVGGRPVADVPDWLSVALLPQRLGLADELTVAENAYLPCWLHDRVPAADLLAALGLDEVAARPAGSTSLGEQQRTGLARALSARPALVVLDEPTGHQDDEHVERVLTSLRLAREAGSAVLVATHDERVVRVADRVVHLDGGRVVRAP